MMYSILLNRIFDIAYSACIEFTIGKLFILLNKIFAYLHIM